MIRTLMLRIRIVLEVCTRYYILYRLVLGRKIVLYIFHFHCWIFHFENDTNSEYAGLCQYFVGRNKCGIVAG